MTGMPMALLGSAGKGQTLVTVAASLGLVATTCVVLRYALGGGFTWLDMPCPCQILGLEKKGGKREGARSRHLRHASDETEERGEMKETEGSGLAQIQTVSVLKYMRGNAEERRRECEKAAESLYRTGCLLVRDWRVKEEDNTRFLDLLERYFESSDGERDARPQLGYQVGVTPAFAEQPRNHCDRIARYPEEDRPRTLCPPEADPKWRFFWRIGPKPEMSLFPELNVEAVVPPDFESEWRPTMDMWGHKMLDATTAVAAMAAEGFGLQPDAFTKMMQNGPHLLAPTGSDFERFGKLDTVLAGYHYDLNFMTIHGKSRFPGLYIWLRDGKKVQVRVPNGCLLVQAGKQMEYLTGGRVLAGFHEVVVCSDTVQAIERRRAQGKSLWRVSSTLFSHIASDQLLRPLHAFSSPEANSRFPPVYAGDQVMEELKAIKLGAGFSLNGKSAPPSKAAAR